MQFFSWVFNSTVVVTGETDELTRKYVNNSDKNLKRLSLCFFKMAVTGEIAVDNVPAVQVVEGRGQSQGDLQSVSANNLAG